MKARSLASHTARRLFLLIASAQSAARRLGLLHQPNNANYVNPFKMIRSLMLGW